MSYKIETIRTFDIQAKRLSKKYHSLKKDILDLVTELIENPHMGTALGKNCYKIRMAISSKSKGKSGGARVITHIQIINGTVYLLSIFDKSEKDSILESEIDILIKEILE